MGRFMLGEAVWVAGALVGFAWAAEVKVEPQLRLEVNLVDGSRIIGTPAIKSMPMQTSYAKLDVPLQQILAIKMGDDRETASLELKNGDQLKGVILLGPVKLETMVGQVSIGLEHIKDIHVVLSGGPLPASLQRGLILHYTFDKDEGDQVTDESGKGHTGRRHGGHWVAAGPLGGALALTVGTDNITSSDTGFPDGDQPRSLARWCYTDDFPPDSWGSGMCYGTKDNNQFAGLGIDRRANRCNFCYSQFGGIFLSTARATTGTWQHLVYTYGSGGRHSFYVDGRLSNGLNELGAVNTVLNGTFKIAASEPLPAGLHSVAMFDDVRVYDRELSAEEIRSLFEAGSRGRAR